MNRVPTSLPRDYRRRLYDTYSANFGAGRRFDPGIQFRQYEACYGSVLPRPGSVVGDLGCGNGEWLAWLRSKGLASLWGVDRSAADLAVARTENPTTDLVEGDICEALAAHPARFDLLHAKDVAEHLKRDELFEFLDACRFALKPGGMLWLLTFNAQSPFASATRYGDFTHEIGLTPTSMCQVLTAAGFTSVQVRGIHTCPGTPGGFARKWLWRVVGACSRVVLRARHGGSAQASVDTFSAAPDLFAIAHTPPVGP